MCPVLAYPAAIMQTTPSPGFLTFLAAAGFAGAVLLTPSVELEYPPLQSSILPAVGGTVSHLSPPGSTLGGQGVARYEHLPPAQNLPRPAPPANTQRGARGVLK